MDRLEQQYEGKLIFIRLNIQEDLGRQLAPVYGFEFTPTFIFFDEQGTEVWRLVGDFDEERLHKFMAGRKE